MVAILGFALLVRARIGAPRRLVPQLALIGVLIVAADAAYAAAATLGRAGGVAVLAALHTVVTVALAAAVLRERIDLVQRCGVAAALVGVVAVTVV